MSLHIFPLPVKTSKEHGMCKRCNKTVVHKHSKSKKSTITNEGCKSNTTKGQPALGTLSDRSPPKGFKPAYSTRIQASIPMAS